MHVITASRPDPIRYINVTDTTYAKLVTLTYSVGSARSGVESDYILNIGTVLTSHDDPSVQ